MTLRRGVCESESKVFGIAKNENIRLYSISCEIGCFVINVYLKVSKPRSALFGVNSPVLPGGCTEAGQKGWHMACQCRFLFPFVNSSTERGIRQEVSDFPLNYPPR